ncbi:MAG: undecaprenyl-diphosphate phosphatase, partial [Deltaproteobacteria bacterium]|nr:undecaprenyl-diphosphate phosphatase [Deltaproteobacteria bacterium]
MSLLQAIFLGILQGATEFLPVSSSGHLLLAQRLLGIREPELAFDLLLHLGTLFAVLVFLRREIVEILGSLLRRERGGQTGGWGRRELLLLVLSTIPTGIIGIAFHDTVETGISFRGMGVRYLLLTSFLLMSNLRFRHKWDPERIEIWEAVAIGIMQGAAIFPGLSRSGSTIVLALLLGTSPSRSAKFSFLISLPAILGAALVNVHKGISVLPGAVPSIAGFLFSMLVGYLALLVVARLVTRGRFIRFAPYTLLLSILCFYL